MMHGEENRVEGVSSLLSCAMCLSFLLTSVPDFSWNSRYIRKKEPSFETENRTP